MSTKVILNTSPLLKSRAMKKAKAQGLTLSAVLNLAMQGYVDDSIRISTFESALLEGMKDVRAGRVHTLTRCTAIHPRGSASGMNR